MDAFLRFRHFGRPGSYRERILLDRLESLAAQVEPVMEAVAADFAGFWGYGESGARDLERGMDVQ